MSESLCDDLPANTQSPPERDTEDNVTKLSTELANTKSQLKTALKRAEKAERQNERTLSYNEDLRKQVDVLSRELHQYKNRDKRKTNQSTQTPDTSPDTSQDSLQGGGDYQPKPTETSVTMVTDHSSTQSNPPDQITITENAGVSLADSLRATAEAAAQQTGFVYDENTGLYYDSVSGYFYDNENSLYFDPPTGTYFYYDEISGEYKFHSQVDMTEYYKSQTDGATDSYGNPSQQYSNDHLSQDTTAHRKTDRRKQKRDRPSKERAEEKDRGRKKAKNERRKKSKNKKKDQDIEMDFEDEENITKHENDSGDVEEKMSLDNIQTEMIDDKEDESVQPNTGLGEDEDKKTSVCKRKEKAYVSDGHDSASASQSSDTDSESESELESGELTESELSSPDSSSEQESGEDVDTTEAVDEANPLNYPPCIRVMVTESEVVEPGTLFVITYPGGTIGREGSHVILLPEISVSKMHAAISYSEEDKQYRIIDCGSQNGTFVNGSRLAEAKSSGSPHRVAHDDVVKIASSSLLCHIHPGLNTCDQCEPGQVRATLQAQQQPEKDVVILSKDEKEKLRRSQLKQIRKKYGLANDLYVKNSALKNPAYSDKAEERRQTVGSDNPYQKTETPSSVHRPISSINKGHKLLQKMGWSEGDSLGKDNSGICEPVKVSFRLNKSAGLGSVLGRQTDLDNANAIRPNQNWFKAQQRFMEISADPSAQNATENPDNKTVQKSAPKFNFVQGETLDFSENINSMPTSADTPEEQ